LSKLDGRQREITRADPRFLKLVYIANSKLMDRPPELGPQAVGLIINGEWGRGVEARNVVA
jgi:hypothetical protein